MNEREHIGKELGRELNVRDSIVPYPRGEFFSNWKIQRRGSIQD